MKDLEAKSPLTNTAKNLKRGFKFINVDLFIRTNELAFRKLKPSNKLTIQKYLDTLSKKIKINKFISKRKPINKELLNCKSIFILNFMMKEYF